jgi:POT family proton-dependent oligopeptide transporter
MSSNADSLNAAAANNKGFFGHPWGLSTLFLTEMWERFSFYGIRPLLTLFMAAAMIDGGFGFERTQATAIVGIYSSSVYLASLPGGWIADRLLGLRRAILYGAILISLGHISIGLSGFSAGKTPFFIGLILIVLGTGLLKPNISAIVGDLYPEGGARRDAGFSIFYMGINTGAFFAPLITGLLGEKYGWHLGFGAAGVGMLIGLAVYIVRSKSTLGNLGMEPTKHPDPTVQASRESQVKIAVAAGLGIIALVVVLAFTGVITLDAQMVIGVLFIAAAIFWGAFEQAPTSLGLFAKDFTDRTIFGYEIPATWLQAVNSLFIIILAPVFAVIWTGLAKKGVDFSSPAKFALGLAFAAVGFIVMIFAANIVVGSNGAVKVSMMWLVVTYLFHTFGELCLSPVGLSSMTKLSPRRYVGQMMGIWFLAASLGNLIAGLVGGSVDPEKLDQMPKLFTWTTVALAASAIVLALLAIPISKMMRNVSDEEKEMIEATGTASL